MIKIIKNFFGKFKSEITIKTDTVPPIFHTKRIAIREIMEGDPHWWHYYNEIVQIGKASALCGLPERSYTEIIDDPKIRNRIIRYIKA